MRVGVIFDMDGVLVDSADAHRRAWQELGDEVGTPFTTPLFQQTFGQRNASIIPTWLGPTRAGALGAQRIEQLAERKEALYRQRVRAGGVRVYPGVPQLIAQLRVCGAAVAVASSGPRENVSLLIDIIGVRESVDVLVTSEDVTQGKPDPEAFLKAAQRLSIGAAHCAVIEDSVHGIEAAKRAGMLAVAVLTSTARAALLAAGADQVVAEAGAVDPTELVRIIAARRIA